MNTQSLLFGIVGFLLGGLVVSIAATQLDESNTASGDEMTMSQISADLVDKNGHAFDAAFITSMIEHHQGAIDMARLAESRAKHAEIKELAREIISAQEGEIAQMERWQREWGYDSMTDPQNHTTH